MIAADIVYLFVSLYYSVRQFQVLKLIFSFLSFFPQVFIQLEILIFIHDSWFLLVFICIPIINELIQ